MHLLSVSGPSCGTPPEALLHHFELNWARIFVLPSFGIPTTFETPLLHLAVGRPHLLNALLAISAAHLRHHAPNPAAHRLAEHFQQALALRSFNELIAKPMSSLPTDEVRVLPLTAIIFNLLTFALPADEDPAPGAPTACATEAAEQSDPDPSRSWVFSTRPARLDWLAVHLGLRELIVASLPYQDEIPCHDMGKECVERNNYCGPLTECEAGADASVPRDGPELDDRVPDAWVELFGVPRKPPGRSRNEPSKKKKKELPLLDNEEARDRLFREPLFLLAETRDMAPTMANIFNYFQLLGRLQPEFKALLYEREPRALWAFGYWLGLVCRFDYIWWVTRRARRDFSAIVIWLRSSGVAERPGREGVLWAEMLRDLEASVNWAAPCGNPGRALEWIRPLCAWRCRCAGLELTGTV